MNEYRKFSHYSVALLALLLLFHSGIWLFTKTVMQNTEHDHVGDLSRLGYLVQFAQRRTLEVDLPRRHTEYYQAGDQSFEIATLGDSFSRGSVLGRNSYYQDYLATVHGLNVLNVPDYGKKNTIETAVILANSGYLRQMGVKHLILERVERECVRVLGRKLDPSMSESVDAIKAYYRTERPVERFPSTGFMNAGNVKFLLYSVLYRFSDHAFFSKTFVRDLVKPLFTHGDGKKLLFYYEDLEMLPAATPENVARVNENLNTLAALLQKQGITLHFLPAPDKYTVYYKFIRGNEYPPSRFFEELRTLPKQYDFIDTKRLFEQAHETGEKDIYCIDDTHWNWKASEIIARTVKF